MQYTTINHTITLICFAGHGAWLSKADITSVFKVLPIHPDFWHFFPVCWKGAYYFAPLAAEAATRSSALFQKPCGRSGLTTTGSPTYSIFLTIFLVITPPSLTSSLQTNYTHKSLIRTRRPSLRREKPQVLAPPSSFTLVSISFQAPLPPEKIQCINLLLSNYLLAHRCTKR